MVGSTLRNIRTYRIIAVVVIVMAAVSGLSANDDSEKDARTVKKAVERSALNQPGTKPFHLKAVLAPSRERDKDSGRTGEVEIWWASPAQYRREVRSPDFHQIAIVNGGKEWQKNEGDYFPEWLREIAVAVIDPIPPLDQVLQDVKEADVKRLMGSTYYSWTDISTDGNVQTNMGASVAVTDNTGLLFYCGGFGWGGGFKDYQSFHGRMVPRTVSWGTPEVTANVTTLEDLRETPPGFFDAGANGSDTPLLRTELVEEASLRKNLLRMESPTWPALQDGPLEGAVTTEIVVDRTGQVREVGSVVANNQGVYEVARKVFAAMRFSPYMENGAAVQVVARISLPFKTVRPPGVETFDSAQTYFERGRQAGFPAAGTGTPYVLHADFDARGSSGTVEKGLYEDTWPNDTHWRREAWFGKSHYVRSRNGEKRYLLAEGPEASLLKLMLKVMEPIPAIDTFVESDWKIKRDTVNGVPTVRVLTGYESPEGELDPEHARGYWFDATGNLLKTYSTGIETERSDFQNLDGAEVARQIKVLHNGALGMLIRVTQMSSTESLPVNNFELRGHEWIRAFTDEVR